MSTFTKHSFAAAGLFAVNPNTLPVQIEKAAAEGIAARTLEEHEALCREADECRERDNRAWCAARWALNEWHDLHDEFTYAIRSRDEEFDLQAIRASIDDLEARHPLLAQGVPTRPPYPFSAPFI